MRSVTTTPTGYIFEPIVTLTGGLLGFDLVKKQQQPDNDVESKNHEHAAAEGKLKMFFDQVTLACVNARVFIDNNFLLSIKIDDVIAENIIKNTAMLEVLRQHPFIRLVINEDFSEYSTLQETSVLRVLSECCPLWMDNFGDGRTSLSVIMKIRFEHIKMSQHFFWQHQGTQSLRHTLDHINAYCKGAIITGVESAQHIKSLRDMNITAMQGILWIPYGQEEFIHAFYV